MSTQDQMGRRAALTVLGAAGAVSVCGIQGCGDDGSGSALPTAATDVGAVSDFTAPVFKLLNTNLIVGRDNMGFFALSAICPHEQCVVRFRNPASDGSSTDGSTSCPCHASRFTAEGAVVSGPSPGPLRPLGVRITNGRVFVDPSITGVTTATRTMA
ncbi:MAG: Rieske (2Fe-2S) protein [Myxococcales bacterium]|nr:Rieske (2Fe-2S) protein [Myxococcales bacterium]